MQPNAIWNSPQFLDELEIELSRLASSWRDADDPQAGDALVHQYQQTLRSMILLGFRKWLDADAELPDEYMPPEYLSGDFRKNAVSVQGEIPFAEMITRQNTLDELNTTAHDLNIRTIVGYVLYGAIPDSGQSSLAETPEDKTLS
ncbi:MAG: hypothetical protein ABI835_08895 [Chloroflexota bacterium]